MTEPTKTLILVRQDNLVQVLEEDFGIVGERVSVDEVHWDSPELKEMEAVGILPMAKASKFKRVLVPDLRIPAGRLGAELSLEEYREMLYTIRVFQVKEEVELPQL